MKLGINVVFCALVVVLTGPSSTRGQSSALPPALTTAVRLSHAGHSAPPDLREDPGNELSQPTQAPADRDGPSAQTTALTKRSHSETSAKAADKTQPSATSPTVATHTVTSNPGAPSPSAAAHSLLSTPPLQSTAPARHRSSTETRALLTRDPLTTSSSQSAHTAQDVRSTAHASTFQPQTESQTAVTVQPTLTGGSLTPASGQGPAGPEHREVPSELNVGDEDHKGPRSRSSSPLDPLLAALLSVFIVTTAIVFVILFLKFRQRTNHPEFHRLQDLPMDDLMEDTPLSRYSH
ncbi:uncharacterized protein V6R79_023725 [Siganus canaliculatus]